MDDCLSGWGVVLDTLLVHGDLDIGGILSSINILEL